MAKYRTREVIVEARQVFEYEELEIAELGTYCASDGDWIINWDHKIYVLPDEVFQGLFAPITNSGWIVPGLESLRL